MSASAWRFVRTVVVALAGLAATLLIGGHRGAVALAVYLAVLTGVVVLACARVVARSLPPSPLLGRPPSPGRKQRPGKLPQLAWIEGRVSRAYGSPEGVAELRPLLAHVVSAELERTRGVSLERSPERARELLGERLWTLVAGAGDADPGRLEVAQLRRLVDELEQTPVTPSELAAAARALLDEVERAVVGKRDALALVLMGLLADGHVLLEDYPGLAKTLIARSFATTCRMRFTRVQFTPDLMPADVTGSSIYDQRRGEFEFRPGPIFTNLLLADEINRAPPKTQAAMLEAMQERQVTTEGVTRPLERPFLVLATQNPIEFEGTYPLPEAQLDRFLLRVSVGYPAREDEVDLLARRLERRQDEVELEAIVDAAELRAMQDAVEEVHVSEPIRFYIVDLVAATRESPRVVVGSSPRGSLALLKLSRCRAILAGRDFVTPDDVKAVAVPALAHRLSLRPELWVQEVGGADVVREVLDSVPAPVSADVEG